MKVYCLVELPEENPSVVSDVTLDKDNNLVPVAPVDTEE